MKKTILDFLTNLFKSKAVQSQLTRLQGDVEWYIQDRTDLLEEMQEMGYKVKDLQGDLDLAEDKIRELEVDELSHALQEMEHQVRD